MTFGARLRQEREARGIALDEVAAATKIARRHLEALEADEFDGLPGDVFVKGYVRAVAEFIGADADALVADYLSQRSAGVEPDAEAETAVVREMSRVLRVGGESGSGQAHSARPIRWAVGAAAAVVVVATLAWIVVGPSRPERDGAPVAAPPNPAPKVRTEPTAPPAKAPVEAPPPPPVAPVEPPVKKAEPPPPAAKPPVSKPAPPPAKPAPPPAKPRTEASPPPSPQPAKSPAKAAPRPPAPPSELLVSEYGVGRDVVDRRIVGQSETFHAGNHVWFWTRVLRGGPGDTIRHVWIHEGRPVGFVDLEVGSGNWSTQSRRLLGPDSEGGWSVEARDSSGRVLARAAFVCFSQ